jgi:hypothetical protein
VKHFLPLLLCFPVFAASTATWEMSSYSDFVKGKFTGVALDADGRLTVAPQLDTLLNSGESVLWSVVQAPDGAVYAATGHGGKVFRIAPNGKSEIVWTAPQPEVFALAIGPDHALYAAASPDGKIVRIENGRAADYFDPHEKYIWSLTFGPDGALYAGTGNRGVIYRIPAQGKGEIYYSTGQAHITSLAFDNQGRLLAGSEPNGILYRITAKNQAFVLYDSTLPEIRSLAVLKDGSILAAAMGGSIMSRVGASTGTLTTSGAGASGAAAVSVTVTDDGTSTQAGPDLKTKAPAAAPAATVTQQTATFTPLIDISGVEKSAVYRIRPDNTVETLWSSKDENLYDIAPSGPGIYLATDQQGRVYRLNPNRQTELVLQTGEGEATRLIETPRGLLAATGDLGKLFRIGNHEASSGAYESPIHDSGAVARWGHLSWRSSDDKATVRFSTRSGNSLRPDSTWSPWSAPITSPSNNAIQSPNARYIQWRAELSPGAEISDVSLAYLPQNSPPVVRSVSVNSVQSTRSASTSTSSSSAASYSITVTDTGESPNLSSGTPAQTVGRSSAGQIQISWQADDPDGDKLVYALYFRGDGERDWKLLKDRLTENTFNLDGDSLADGRYRFRVVASDRPSNPPAEALEAQQVSAPVWIDNTPPAVHIDNPQRTAVGLELDVIADDAASSLKRCEYSIDAGPWTLVEAVDGITDSPHERFHIAAPAPAGEHLVVVRVLDTAGNAGLAKAVIR